MATPEQIATENRKVGSEPTSSTTKKGDEEGKRRRSSVSAGTASKRATGTTIKGASAARPPAKKKSFKNLKSSALAAGLWLVQYLRGIKTVKDAIFVVVIGLLALLIGLKLLAVLLEFFLINFQWLLLTVALGAVVAFSARKGVKARNKRKGAQGTSVRKVKSNGIIDAAHCVAYGQGVSSEAGIVGEEIRFKVKLACSDGTVYVGSLDSCNFKMEITGEAVVIPTCKWPSAIPKEDGEYEITYTAKKAGHYNVIIQVKEQIIDSGSPYKINIRAGPMDPAKSQVSGPGLGPIPLTLKEVTFVIVQARDAFANEHRRGGLPSRHLFSVEMEGTRKGKKWSRKLECSIGDNSDGTYKIRFVPPKCGIFAINIKHGGRLLKDGRSNVCVLKPKELKIVHENVERKHVIFKMMLNSTAAQVVLTQKLLIIDYLSEGAPTRVYTARLKPSIKVEIEENSSTGLVLEFENGERVPLSCKERSIFYSTYMSYLNLQIKKGCSNYEDRYCFFENELRKIHAEKPATPCTVTVNANNLLPSAYTALKDKSLAQWRSNFSIMFEEQGLDPYGNASSLVSSPETTVRFFSLLEQELFSMKNGLFGFLSAFGEEEHAASMNQLHISCGLHPIRKMMFPLITPPNSPPSSGILEKQTPLARVSSGNLERTCSTASITTIETEGTNTQTTNSGGDSSSSLLENSATDVMEQPQQVPLLHAHTFDQELSELLQEDETSRRSSKKNLRKKGSSDSNRGNEERLDYFRLVGLFLAKCIYDRVIHTREGHFVGVRLSRSFYKQLLGLPVHYADLESDDPSLYSTKVKFILENNYGAKQLTRVVSTPNIKNQILSGSGSGAPSTFSPTHVKRKSDSHIPKSTLTAKSSSASSSHHHKRSMSKVKKWKHKKKGSNVAAGERENDGESEAEIEQQFRAMMKELNFPPQQQEQMLKFTLHKKMLLVKQWQLEKKHGSKEQLPSPQSLRKTPTSDNNELQPPASSGHARKKSWTAEDRTTITVSDVSSSISCTATKAMDDTSIERPGASGSSPYAARHRRHMSLVPGMSLSAESVSRPNKDTNGEDKRMGITKAKRLERSFSKPLRKIGRAATLDKKKQSHYRSKMLEMAQDEEEQGQEEGVEVEDVEGESEDSDDSEDDEEEEEDEEDEEDDSDSDSDSESDSGQKTEDVDKAADSEKAEIPSKQLLSPVVEQVKKEASIVEGGGGNGGQQEEHQQAQQRPRATSRSRTGTLAFYEQMQMGAKKMVTFQGPSSDTNENETKKDENNDEQKRPRSETTPKIQKQEQQEEQEQDSSPQMQRMHEEMKKVVKKKKKKQAIEQQQKAKESLHQEFMGLLAAAKPDQQPASSSEETSYNLNAMDTPSKVNLAKTILEQQYRQRTDRSARAGSYNAFLEARRKRRMLTEESFESLQEKDGDKEKSRSAKLEKNFSARDAREKLSSSDSSAKRKGSLLSYLDNKHETTHDSKKMSKKDLKKEKKRAKKESEKNNKEPPSSSSSNNNSSSNLNNKQESEGQWNALANWEKRQFTGEALDGWANILNEKKSVEPSTSAASEGGSSKGKKEKEKEDKAKKKELRQQKKKAKKEKKERERRQREKEKEREARAAGSPESGNGSKHHRKQGSTGNNFSGPLFSSVPTTTMDQRRRTGSGLSNDGNNAGGIPWDELGITFTDDIYENGKLRARVELKPDGSQILVTQENKLEYLFLLSDFRLRQLTEKQMKKVKDGFFSLINEELLYMFDENELELLFCGLPSVKAEDIREHVSANAIVVPEEIQTTENKQLESISYWKDSDEVAQWFWSAVDNFTTSDRARLLQFITGTVLLPEEGLKELRPPIRLCKSNLPTNSLPHADLNNNRLYLPAYTSYKELYDNLTCVVSERGDALFKGQ
ncbi:E3 ubiquitin-protein ligase huwe1 [Balamuthia mandrillaris]